MENQSIQSGALTEQRDAVSVLTINLLVQTAQFEKHLSVCIIGINSSTVRVFDTLTTQHESLLPVKHHGT